MIAKELTKRACLSIFIYGETNKQFRKQFRARVKNVYGKTSKIKEKALSWNQRQENQNAYYTKTFGWISSKLTPADASRTCASFCISRHGCADPILCAIAVSLPSTANILLKKFIYKTTTNRGKR